VKRVCCAIFLLMSVILSSTALAVSSESVQARDIVRRGTWEAGLAVGYLQGLDVLTSASANRSAIYALPRLGRVVTPIIGKSFYEGNLQILVEPLYAHYFKPFGASAAGGSLLFKYNFLAFGRWMPYWDVGLGMLWTNLAPRIREQSTQFNFVLETGPGTQYFLSSTVAWGVGVRFHHISNAGIGERNRGLNSVLAYTGISFFFP
jgi:lipid A 3-O-deacylase